MAKHDLYLENEKKIGYISSTRVNGKISRHPIRLQYSMSYLNMDKHELCYRNI